MPGIRLERQTLCSRRRVPIEGFQQGGITINPTLFFREEIGYMLLDLEAHLYGEPVNACISYPATWWDAVKKRFFPPWLVRGFPILYKEHNVRATAFYPDISMPDRRPFIYCATQTHSFSYVASNTEEITANAR